MSEPPRITHVVLALGAGGTERLVIDLCLALAPNAEVRVICLDELGVWASELTDAGIEVQALGRQPGFDFALVRRVAAELRAQRAEIVHCHHYTPYIYGWLGSMLGPRARVVYTEHGRLTDAPWTLKRRVANAVFGRLRAKFFAVSENLREHMVDGGIPDRRVKVIYNGIRTLPPPDTPAREHARAQMEVVGDAKVIGTVARLDPVKDLPTLVNAFARYRTSQPKAVLAVVGDGGERSALERECDALGLAGAVRFLGHRDDARALLAGFDVYVNCSITEGVSVTILEAMANGLPVIVTGVGGTPEVVQHEVNGLLIEPRDADALLSALERLDATPALAQTLGGAARERIETHFTTDTMLASYVRAYGLER